jgi:hypothetical protein
MVNYSDELSNFLLLKEVVKVDDFVEEMNVFSNTT